MATLLTRHACRALTAHSSVSLRASLPQRTIHATATLQKKKGKAVIDDLFGDDAFSPDSLLSAESKSQSSTSTSTSGSPSSTPTTPSTSTQKASASASAFRRLKLSPTERARRFSAELAFVEPRIGRNPALKTPHVRKRVWFGLLDLAQTREDLERVVELWPRYVGGAGREGYPEGLAGDFVRRCAELKCPALALQVFGDWARYNLDLDLPAARLLVHSLASPLVVPSSASASTTSTTTTSTTTTTQPQEPPPSESTPQPSEPKPKQPLDNLLLALSLYPIYALPPVSSDLPTAAMAAAACFAHGGDKAVRLAEELVPCIAGLVEQSSNAHSIVGEEGKGSGVGKEKEGEAEAKAKGKVKGVKEVKGKVKGAKVAKGKEGKAKEEDIESAMVEKWTKGALRRVSKEVEKRTGKGLDLGRLEGVVQIQSAKLAPPSAEATA